jgi:31-O-methyltransferase
MPMTAPSKYRLPNGLEVFHFNRNETRYLYREIFEQREYVPDGGHLPEGATVVDIGANIGMFSLFAITEWQPSRLIAVEPIPALLEPLRLNLGRFENTQVLPVGAGRTRETCSFTYYPGFSLMSGRYCDSIKDRQVAKSYALWEARSLSEEDRISFEESLDDLLEYRFAAVATEVEVWSVSQILRECDLSRVDILKIDAEGSELDILQGILDEDWPKIINIVVEVDEERVELADVLDTLKAHDMTCDLRQFDAYSETAVRMVYAHRGLSAGTQERSQ